MNGYSDLIIEFVKEVPKNKGIEAHFQNYTNNSGQIQELFSKRLDKSQATLQQITDIMTSTEFTLSIDNSKESYLNFEGKLTIQDEQKHEGQKTIMINYDLIIDLRERAMLTRKLGNEKEKEISNLYQLFSERVNEIEKINQLLKKLGEKGYSEDIKVIININKNEPSFRIDGKLVKNYEDCSKYLSDIYSKITEIQTKYYKNEELIRYIYGRQFNLLNSCLRKDEEKIYIALLPFLKFITNDQIDANGKFKALNFGFDYDLKKKNN